VGFTAKNQVGEVGDLRHVTVSPSGPADRVQARVPRQHQPPDPRHPEAGQPGPAVLLQLGRCLAGLARSGLGMVELALLAEESGYVLHPVPWWATVGLATQHPGSPPVAPESSPLRLPSSRRTTAVSR
jgi:hypothetical protein